MMPADTDVVMRGRCAPLTHSDIPALRSLLISSLPESAHMASICEAMAWSPDRIARRSWGVWDAGELVAVLLAGQVIRVLSTSPDARSPLHDLLLSLMDDQTLAVMGSDDIITSLQATVVRPNFRSFVVWERLAEQTDVAGVRPPDLAELPSFAAVSFNAFGEEMGWDPAPHPQDPAYLALWQRASEQGRILGAWDDDGRCVYRVEIRPALGAVAELRGVWLDPALRGAGLARSFVDATVGYVGATIAPRVQVIVDADNTVATRLYRSAGFAPVGRLSRLDLPQLGGDRR
jgi:RimJ/RimL family protein N-acetyltransferase